MAAILRQASGHAWHALAIFWPWAVCVFAHLVPPAVLGVPDEALNAFLTIVHSGLADYLGVDWSLTEPHIQANRLTAQGGDSRTHGQAVHALERGTRGGVSCKAVIAKNAGRARLVGRCTNCILARA